MRCSWVQERLVALADGELSAGEATRTEEHLEHCIECRELDADLRMITPRPTLQVPPEIMARMAAAVDSAIEQTFDAPESTPAPRTGPLTRWLPRDRDLSNGAMLGYGLILAACVGWGVSNWLAVQQLEERNTPPVAQSAQPTPSTLDGDQYEPASYRPEEPEEEWR